jgi:hypothetical protein
MYELFDPRHLQCWHVTASPVSWHSSGRGIAPVAKQFWLGGVLQMTTAWSHYLLWQSQDDRFDPRYLQNWHTTSSSVSLHFLCLWIDSGVKQFWQWLVYCDWQLQWHTICGGTNNFDRVVGVGLFHRYCHATLWDIPTHQLFDPWQLKCWHATSSTVSCIFYCRWIAAVVKQFWGGLARCKWQLHCFSVCDCPTW